MVRKRKTARSGPKSETCSRSDVGRQFPTVQLSPADKRRITGRIGEELKASGMTFADLHGEVRRLLANDPRGTSYTSVWNYVHHDPEKNAPPTHARRAIYTAIAKALGISPAWLIDDEGPRNRSEEKVAEIEELLPRWEEQWAAGARAEMEGIAPLLVKVASPAVRAMFLDTLRALIRHRWPQGGAKSADVRELATRLSHFVIFVPRIDLGIGEGGFSEREWDSYCIAALQAVQLRIPPRTGEKVVEMMDEASGVTSGPMTGRKVHLT